MGEWGGAVGGWLAGWRTGALAVAAVVLLIALAPGRAGAETRYSEAGGCFNLASASSGATAPSGASLRFQATDLGSYLLYRQAGDFLAAGAGSSVAAAAQPSPRAAWGVEGGGAGGLTPPPKS